MTQAPIETRWVSFADEDQTTYLFDLSFLTSGWSCTFGTTCKGTEPQDNGARGCCAHGAHMVDDDETDTIIDIANRLTADQWQNHSLVEAPADIFEEDADGETKTRTLNDACIFLNDQTFEGGHGCALHIGAIAAKERPLDWKPAVCWQVPFRLEQFEDENGKLTLMVRAWRRSDWGEGGDDFGWWCTDELPESTPGNATWLHHQDELIELVGEWPVQLLNDYLSENYGETPVELSRKP